MFKNAIEEIWQTSEVLKSAFQEHILCVRDVYLRTAKTIISPLHTPVEFNITTDDMPDSAFTLEKNIFSTLFQSVYHLLGIKKERRELYGKLNHLFRTWVTSADNLLDNEDKVVIPLKMPGNSRIMCQVISIMAADRILKQIMDEAVGRNVISPSESNLLSDKSLQILLPSAVEEASEESGVANRHDPDYVLFTIHRLKTGLLFHIPFLGPDTVEDNIDSELLSECKDALGKFGVGCQLLDDIRDMTKDYLEKRYNYVLSKIYFEDRSFYIDHLERLKREMNIPDKVFKFFPEAVYPTARLAKSLLEESLSCLSKAGLDIDEQFIEPMVFSMFRILDVGELIECAQTQCSLKLIG